MGVRSIFAAAVLALGVGQAEAATVDYVRKVTMTLTENRICNLTGCETRSSGYRGLALNDATVGTLSIQSDQLTQNPDWWYGRFGITLRDASGRMINVFGVDAQGQGKFDQTKWSFSAYTEYWLTWDGTTGEYREIYGDEHASFFITIALAPIPVPVSAALLPVGLGALAMFRKRRRSI